MQGDPTGEAPIIEESVAKTGPAGERQEMWKDGDSVYFEISKKMSDYEKDPLFKALPEEVREDFKNILQIDDSKRIDRLMPFFLSRDVDRQTLDIALKAGREMKAQQELLQKGKQAFQEKFSPEEKRAINEGMKKNPKGLFERILGAYVKHGVDRKGLLEDWSNRAGSLEKLGARYSGPLERVVDVVESKLPYKTTSFVRSFK